MTDNTTKERTSITINKDIHDAGRAAAKKLPGEGRKSFSALVELALLEWFDANLPKSAPAEATTDG